MILPPLIYPGQTYGSSFSGRISFSSNTFIFLDSTKWKETLLIKFIQWKRISHKQSARWKHLSQLKASAFLSSQIILFSCMKRNNLYSRLVMPSTGQWSPSNSNKFALQSKLAWVTAILTCMSFGIAFRLWVQNLKKSENLL